MCPFTPYLLSVSALLCASNLNTTTLSNTCSNSKGFREHFSHDPAENSPPRVIHRPPKNRESTGQQNSPPKALPARNHLGLKTSRILRTSREMLVHPT